MMLVIDYRLIIYYFCFINYLHIILKFHLNELHHLSLYAYVSDNLHHPKTLWNTKVNWILFACAMLNII